MKETFGQRFSRLRKAKGMTQEVIAEKMNISPQAVSKWENDLSAPDVSLLLPLAELLGVTTDTLLGKEDPAAHSRRKEGHRQNGAPHTDKRRR